MKEVYGKLLRFALIKEEVHEKTFNIYNKKAHNENYSSIFVNPRIINTNYL